MDTIEKLINNPLFYKWIFSPSEELEIYWKGYFAQNPEDSEHILNFKRQFEKYLKFENKKLNEIEKRALAHRIVQDLDRSDQKKEGSITLRNFMRYAAVGLLFFTMGSMMVYIFLNDRQPEIIVENVREPSGTHKPMLIINDDEEIELKEGECELDYSNPEDIIVGKNKVRSKKDKGKNPEMNTLIIPYGNRSVITLSDSTKVWLNAGSRLIYPSEFVDKQREVYLVGEGFFDVKRNEEQPFVVKTTDLEVTVLGTKFNITAYPEDIVIQTILAEGSVKINRENSSLFEKGIILSAGQMGYFNKENQTTKVYEVDVEYYTLWTKGLFRFVDTDINRITKKLERYYNIRLEFNDPLDGVIKITGKLDVTKDKEEVMEYLSKLTGMEFDKINEYRYIVK